MIPLRDEKEIKDIFKRFLVDSFPTKYEIKNLIFWWKQTKKPIGNAESMFVPQPSSVQRLISIILRSFPDQIKIMGRVVISEFILEISQGNIPGIVAIQHKLNDRLNTNLDRVCLCCNSPLNLFKSGLLKDLQNQQPNKWKNNSCPNECDFLFNQSYTQDRKSENHITFISHSVLKVIKHPEEVGWNSE